MSKICRLANRSHFRTLLIFPSELQSKKKNEMKNNFKRPLENPLCMETLFRYLLVFLLHTIAFKCPIAYITNYPAAVPPWKPALCDGHQGHQPAQYRVHHLHAGGARGLVLCRAALLQTPLHGRPGIDSVPWYVIFMSTQVVASDRVLLKTAILDLHLHVTDAEVCLSSMKLPSHVLLFVCSVCLFCFFQRVNRFLGMVTALS